MTPNGIVVGLASGVIVEFLKKITKKLFKSKDKDLNREVKINQDLRDSLQANNIGYIETGGGDFYYFDMRQIPREVINGINQPSSPDEDFRITESKFDREMSEFENKFDFTENELLEKILPHLDPELRSIINLAIGADYEYRAERKENAENIREEIRDFYGRRGNTLCNLYTSGYIDKILDYVQVVEEKMSEIELAKVVNARIEELLRGSIYFVDKSSRIDTLVLEAVKCMEGRIKYIAFHGAGLNAIKVLILVDKLLETGVVKENYQLDWGIPENSPPNAIFFVIKLTRKD